MKCRTKRFVVALRISLTSLSFLIGMQLLICQPVFDSLHQVMVESKDEKSKAFICIRLANDYFSRDLIKARYYADLAMKYATGIDTLLVLAYDKVGKYYFYSNQLDSALTAFRYGIGLAKDCKDLKTAATMGLGLGSVLLRQEKYDEAIDVFIESVVFFEEDQDELSAAKCYSNIATAHSRMQNFMQAIDYNLEALEIFRKHEAIPFLLLTLPNLATQYVQAGDTAQGTRYFVEAEKLAISHEDKRSLALIYNNLGDLYLSKKMTTEAQEFFIKCIDLKKELGQLKGIENNYYNLGYCYAVTGDHINALTLYGQAFQTANATVKVQIRDKMMESLWASGNLQQALVQAKLTMSLRDSLKTAIDVNTFAEISGKYEDAKKQNEILRLETEKQKLEIISARNKYIQVGLISLILVSSILVYLFIKNQKKKQIIRAQTHHLEKQQILEKLKDQEFESIDLVLVGQQEERSKIAADLHDSLGSKMATLKLYLDHVGQENDQSGLAQAKSLATLAYQEVRNISHHLGSGVLPDQGLLPALRNMAAFITSTNQINIEVISVDLKDRLKNAEEIQILRIAQELVTNIIKHANAKNVIIQLVQHEEFLNMMIEDDGVGFDPDTLKVGLGFQNIDRRIDKVGGNYSIDSSPGHGTTVIINVPL